MKTPFFFIGKKLSRVTRQWLQKQQVQFIEQPFPIEQFVSGMFDAYLFFSPTGIDNFKASGNFPNPSSVVLANENSTAREAWKLFTNKVYLSPENEELSFVQYSYTRWMKENNK